MANGQSHSASDLEKSGQIVEETCKDITAVRQQLMREVEALMTGWKGAAANAYLGTYKRFDSEFGDVLSKLDIFHGKLVDTNIQYGRNEAEQVEISNQVANLINR